MTFLVKWYLIVCGAGAGEEFLVLSRTLRALSPNTTLGAPRAAGAGGLGPGPLVRAHGSSVPRSARQLSLEGPIETAILLSLVGVRSIVANQWPTVLQDNAMRASVLWESESCQQPARPAAPRGSRKPVGC